MTDLLTRSWSSDSKVPILHMNDTNAAFVWEEPLLACVKWLLVVPSSIYWHEEERQGPCLRILTHGAEIDINAL